MSPKNSGTVSLHFGYVLKFRGPSRQSAMSRKNSGTEDRKLAFDYVPEFFQCAIKPPEA